MTICDKTQTKFIYNQINPIKGENRNNKYLLINPTGHVPMIQDGQFKVLGGNHIIFVYLAKSKSVIQQQLMPSDNEQAIKSVIGWYNSKMATAGQQLFRILYEPGAYPTHPTQAQYDKWKNDL